MRRLSVFLILGLILAACTGAAEAPTQPPPPPPTNAPPATVLITLTPRPTEGPTPTPTLEFDIFPYEGDWVVNFRYEFNGGDPIQQIRFLGAIPVTIASNGQVFGEGSWITAVQHEGCVAVIGDDGEIPVTVEGQVRQGEAGMEIEVVATPDDPERIEHYRLSCPGFTEPLDIEDQLLWPTLELLQGQPYVLSLDTNTPIETTQDLSGPTNQQRQGTLTTQVRVHRG